MDTANKYALGIDASKDKMDVCLIILFVSGEWKIKVQHKFTNSAKGFKELNTWLKKHCKELLPLTILMEATGVYHEKLAIYLTDEGYNVSIVLPNKARKFMQALGYKSKNDKIDAKGLAQMCGQFKFDKWQPMSKYFYELRQLTRHYQSLVELKTTIGNQKHAMEHGAYISKEVNRQSNKIMALAEKQITETKQAIAKHIASNEDVNRKVNHACKIKGVDILTAATVIAETNGFILFKNIAQLVSYAGYDVIENQSGKHTGKTRISKKGNSRIRRCLYMPAFVVVKYKQHPFTQLYQRVYQRTKIKMKAYVAVQKKILTMIYTLWEKDCDYINGFKGTSGNEEPRVLFPFFSEEKTNIDLKQVVPLYSSTTQDELRYNVSPEALFPLSQT